MLKVFLLAFVLLTSAALATATSLPAQAACGAMDPNGAHGW